MLKLSKSKNKDSIFTAGIMMTGQAYIRETCVEDKNKFFWVKNI